MKIVVTSAAIGAAIGFFGGSFVGVAGFGSGIAGIYVFIPIGALVGFLIGLQLRKHQ
jgi:ABC-type multidrug transport system permease subunit